MLASTTRVGIVDDFLAGGRALLEERRVEVFAVDIIKNIENGIVTLTD